MRVLDEENNPFVGELLRTLRSVGEQENRGGFRATLRRLGAIVAYEISRSLRTREHVCTTPLGRRVERVLDEDPVLVTIMRASLPMWEGMLEVFDRADNAIVGAARREGTVADPGAPELGVDLAYTAWAHAAGRTVIYVDPMIATGSTLRLVHEHLVARAGVPRRVIVAGAIAYRATAAALERGPLHAEVIVASADDSLDARGYIVPGLGDAGDLAFGEKH